ncbi:MAG: DUF4031 domain-containing protein [Acidobacteriota bacterium]
MAVYIDPLGNWGWKHGPSCRLIADSIPELIDFAVLIGLRAEWFQPRSSPHFDLTVQIRERALAAGAIELSKREFVGVIRRLRSEKFGLKVNA